MNPGEAKSFTETSTGPVTLRGGRYMFGVSCTCGGVALQGLLPDGQNWASVKDVNGNPVEFPVPAQTWVIVDLAAGQYKISLSGNPVGPYPIHPVRAVIASAG